jgi:hypothetical protein
MHPALTSIVPHKQQSKRRPLFPSSPSAVQMFVSTSCHSLICIYSVFAGPAIKGFLFAGAATKRICQSPMISSRCPEAVLVSDYSIYFVLSSYHCTIVIWF